MRLTFNKNYFIVFILLFIVEILIAVFFSEGFIRHTVGDFLVVILMYCFLKSFLKTKAVVVAIVTLAIAYLIEFLQRSTFLEYLGLIQNKWANLILGNTFSTQDLVAYTLGIFVVLFFEKFSVLKRITF